MAYELGQHHSEHAARLCAELGEGKTLARKFGCIPRNAA